MIAFYGHVYFVKNQIVKDNFGEGMQDDFQHLEQYGITHEAYQALLQGIAAQSSAQE